MDYRDAHSANTTDADGAMIEDQPRGLWCTRERPDNGEPPKGPDGIISAMPLYTVMVDDNFHYMDEDDRWQLRKDGTAEPDIARARSVTSVSPIASSWHWWWCARP